VLAQDQGAKDDGSAHRSPRAIASKTDAASSWLADKATGLMPRRATTAVYSRVAALSIPVPLPGCWLTNYFVLQGYL
jgi:hypothetical protein